MIRLLLAALLFTSCTVPRTALVIETIDGDTIMILGGYEIRYIGIDTPEHGECGYLDAARINYQLVNGRTVQLIADKSDRDKFGRGLRYVYVDTIMVNEELLRRGLARTASYPPDTANARRFQELENEARSQQLGIWGPTCR